VASAQWGPLLGSPQVGALALRSGTKFGAKKLFGSGRSTGHGFSTGHGDGAPVGHGVAGEKVGLGVAGGCASIFATAAIPSASVSGMHVVDGSPRSPFAGPGGGLTEDLSGVGTGATFGPPEDSRSNSHFPFRKQKPSLQMHSFLMNRPLQSVGPSDAAQA
jgi:hypothetical protein